MPEMRIEDNEGKLSLISSLLTFSYMVSPDDEEERNQIIGSWVFGEAYKAMKMSSIEKLSVSPEFSELLRNTDKLERIFSKLKKYQLVQATTAGLILIMILSLAEHAPKYASFDRVRDLVANRISKKGLPFPESKAHYKKIWGKYKPVSHLWAALILYEDYLERPPNLDLWTEDGLPGFLSLAETIRLEGEKNKFRRGNYVYKNLFTSKEMWKVGSSISIKIGKITWPPIAEEFMSLL